MDLFKYKYACALLVSSSHNLILLIEEKAGRKKLWNGVGCLIKDNEDKPSIMNSVFKTKTQLDITNWNSFCIIEEDSVEIEFFYSIIPTPDLINSKNPDNAIGIWSLSEKEKWFPPVVPKLRIALPLLFEFLKNSEKQTIRLKLSNEIK